MKFRAQEIYDALQNLYGQDLRKGDAVAIQMTAVLSDGVLTNISGEDVLRINSRSDNFCIKGLAYIEQRSYAIQSEQEKASRVLLQEHFFTNHDL